MIIDGRALAEDMLAQLRARTETFAVAPTLRALTYQPDAATRSYLAIKERQAAAAGIHMEVTEVGEADTDSLCALVASFGEDAVIVQLPLPSGIDTDAVLAAVPEEKDADVLSPAARSRGELMPPVVAAVAQVLAAGGVTITGARATVVGRGRLVGEPVAAWLESQGAQVTTVSKEDGSLADALGNADIIVTGAGVPGLITRTNIRPGAVVIDAGTSEQGGAIVGDADPAVADVASVFTPVPGGIGPIAVACLLRNVVTLHERA